MQADGRPEKQPGKTADRKWPHPRDLEVLKWTCEQYAAHLDHVIALTGCSRTTAQLVVARLRDAGFVTTRRFVLGDPTWLLPTWRGMTVAGLHGSPWDPAVSRLTALAAINDVRLHVQARRPGTEWIANRQLRNEHAKAPMVRAGYAKHLPDGVAIRGGEAAAIKVALHFKGRAPTAAILDELTRRYDVTVWFCERRTYCQLLRLAQSGRWPNLRVRPLPGAEWAEVLPPASPRAERGAAR